MQDVTTYDITIRKGSVFRGLSFTYKTGEPGNWTPVDLTGWKARMQVRQSLDSEADAHLTCTTENGRITLDTDGTVTVTIPATATAACTVSAVGVYDIELVPPGGEDYAERILEGKARISREVTR